MYNAIAFAPDVLEWPSSLRATTQCVLARLAVDGATCSIG